MSQAEKIHRKTLGLKVGSDVERETIQTVFFVPLLFRGAYLSHVIVPKVEQIFEAIKWKGKSRSKVVNVSSYLLLLFLPWRLLK